ncbi:suppressor of cytokine signaling 2-like [Ornithodoros turicata]
MWTEHATPASKDHSVLFVAFPVLVPSWAAPATPPRSTSWGGVAPKTPPQPHHSTPRMDRPVHANLDVDLSRVRDTVRTLQTSGYYYEGLSWQDADRMLRDTPIGTFLVRDSSDNRFLFALSVQTERGPTSVRIHYSHGEFRLDCEDALSPCMPWFTCVVKLVEYYIELSQSAKGQMCVWLDGNGRRDLPIRLARPLYRTVHPLQHLCRVAANRGMAQQKVGLDRLPLPGSLKDFVRAYPHQH